MVCLSPFGQIIGLSCCAVVVGVVVVAVVGADLGTKLKVIGNSIAKSSSGRHKTCFKKLIHIMI